MPPPPARALQGLGESLFFDTDVKRIDALVAFLRTLTDRRAWPPIAGRPAG